MTPLGARVRVLMIGGSGQVGRAVLAACPMLEVVAPPRALLDLARPATLAAVDQRFDIVVNAGAYTAVDAAEEDEDAARAVNSAGPAALARRCARLGVPLIHLSTDHVFDGRKEGAYREDDPPGPVNAYGRTKLAGEDGIRAALANHVILRTSWVFSATHDNFVKAIVARARNGEALRVVADQRGSPTPASALAVAIRTLILRARNAGMRWGTYHYAGDEAVTRYAFAAAIVDALKRSGAALPSLSAIATADLPTRAPRPANAALDAALFAATFGIPPAPWRQTLPGVVAALGHAEAS